MQADAKAVRGWPKYISKKEPIPLFSFGDDEAPKAYLCGVCRNVHHHHGNAVYCCGETLCEDCGAVTKARYWTHCEPCRQKREAAKEAELFAKAKKIGWHDYAGWIWLDGAGGCRDGYFESVADLIEWIGDQLHDDPEFDVPDYAWACDEVPFGIDAGGIIESATEDHHEDASDNCDRESLQRLLDDWCAAQGVVSYYYDTDTAVELIGAFDEVIKEAMAARASAAPSAERGAE